MEIQDLERRISELERELQAVLMIAVAIPMAENRRLPDKGSVEKMIDNLSPPKEPELPNSPNALAKKHVNALWPKPGRPFQIAETR
jgi:hypothetical protein